MIHRWLVFFGPACRPWCWVTRRGFGHVMAAGYDAELRLWTFYDPRRESTLITNLPAGDEADRLFGTWARACDPHILRVRPREGRHLSPPMFSCVGAIKALLGIRSGALFPFGLYRDLLARGAEPVPVPAESHGEPEPT